jgi:hypothetical protein
MGEGKSMSELEIDTMLKNSLPENFREIAPKSAALALAEINRYPDHRQEYLLAVDDLDGRAPPDICSIAFSYASPRCYTAIDAHVFLRADPDNSYFAFTLSRNGGAVGYNMISNHPEYEFTWCPVTYQDARHIAHTLWWLNRVRSLTTQPALGYYGGTISISMSSADGKGAFVLRTDTGEKEIETVNTIWSGHVPERWEDNYTPETFLNIADFLLSESLAGQTETSTTQSEMRDAIRLILDHYSLEQTHASLALAIEAVRAVGEHGFSEFNQQLANLQNTLPKNSPPQRRDEDIQKEIDQLLETGADYFGPQVTRLHGELMSVLNHPGHNRIEELRDALGISLRQLSAKNDTKELLRWATSKEPGYQWAFQQLRDKDASSYITALKWWLENTEGRWAQQVYEEISRIAPQHATEIAQGAQNSNITVSAFTHLEEINALNNEEERIQSLIGVALNPESGWEDRGQAIELLAPYDAPLRYPDPRIDKTMLQLFNPALADKTINFTLEDACRALARRQRTEHFGSIAKRMEQAKDLSVYHGILGSLTHLAQADPATLNPELLQLIKPHLTRTNKWLEEVFWAIWAADLRELKPDLETLATAEPKDYEDARAHSYGGEESPVTGRYHMARKIVALWNEEDDLTRAKLMIAWGLEEAYYFTAVDAPPERKQRLEMELRKINDGLSPDGRTAISLFLQKCANLPDDGYTGTKAHEWKIRFLALVNTTIGFNQDCDSSHSTKPSP